LQQYGIAVDVHDPWADAQEAQHELGISLVPQADLDRYQAVVLAVSHDCFRELPLNNPQRSHVLYDTKAFLPKDAVDGRL
jgi:UDP-N-acetyl-D-galactosamine dehydrogenase